mgnify:CR=1 FL=1
MGASGPLWGLNTTPVWSLVAESKLKGVALRIWPLNPTANGRNFNADLAKTVPAAETAKQGFSAVTRKTGYQKALTKLFKEDNQKCCFYKLYGSKKWQCCCATSLAKAGATAL